MTYNFLHDHWTAAVQDYLDGKPLMEVHTAQSFVDMVDLLPGGRQRIVLINKQGQELTARAVTSLRCEGGKDVELPVDMYIVHEAAPDRRLPEIIRIDCTGLGGHVLVDQFRGTSVFVLITMGRIFMAPPWLPLRPLHIIPTEDQGTQWPLASLKPCMSSSCCTTLLQIVLQDGMA